MILTSGPHLRLLCIDPGIQISRFHGPWLPFPSLRILPECWWGMIFDPQVTININRPIILYQNSKFECIIESLVIDVFILYIFLQSPIK